MSSRQAKKFIQAVKDLECSDDEKAFEQTLIKLGSTPPPDTVKARKKQKPKKPAK